MKYFFLFCLLINTGPPKEQELFQAFLDQPELQSYYHSDQKGREQLYIVNNGKIDPNLSLTKFGLPVPIQEVKVLFFHRITNNIAFDSVHVDSSSAYLKAFYQAENIQIEASYAYQAKKWVNTAYSIKEQ